MCFLLSGGEGWMAKTGDSQSKDLDQQETERLQRVWEAEQAMAAKLAEEAAKQLPDTPT